MSNYKLTLASVCEKSSSARNICSLTLFIVYLVYGRFNLSGVGFTKQRNGKAGRILFRVVSIIKKIAKRGGGGVLIFRRFIVLFRK